MRVYIAPGPHPWPLSQREKGDLTSPGHTHLHKTADTEAAATRPGRCRAGRRDVRSLRARIQSRSVQNGKRVAATARLLLCRISTMKSGSSASPQILECGGKRSATPLWIKSSSSSGRLQCREPKRRRRFALPAHSKLTPLSFTRLLDNSTKLAETKFFVRGQQGPFRVQNPVVTSPETSNFLLAATKKLAQ